MPPIRTDKTSERIHCPSPPCEETFGPKRKQDRDRHVMSMHLPLFLLCRRCGRRDGREDEHKKHLKECDPENESKPCALYDKKLVLGWVFKDGTPVETVERYALDFIRELAKKQRKQAEEQGNEVEKQRSQALLNDPCGRRGTQNTGQCQCNENHEASTIATPETATNPTENNIPLPPSAPETLETPLAFPALRSGWSALLTNMPLDLCQDSTPPSSSTPSANFCAVPFSTFFEDVAPNTYFYP